MIAQHWSCEEDSNHIPSTLEIELPILRTVIQTITMDLWRTMRKRHQQNKPATSLFLQSFNEAKNYNHYHPRTKVSVRYRVLLWVWCLCEVTLYFKRLSFIHKSAEGLIRQLQSHLLLMACLGIGKNPKGESACRGEGQRMQHVHHKQWWSSVDHVQLAWYSPFSLLLMNLSWLSTLQHCRCCGCGEESSRTF